MFSEKLDYMMTVLGIRNHSLANHLSYDTSYINRIRHGKRGIPKDPFFLKSVSEYLAGKIQNESDLKKNTLAETLCPDQLWPSDHNTAAELILSWLQEEDPEIPIDEKMLRKTAPLLNDCFYGDEGKRECVLRFFRFLIDCCEPQELLLCSDENMSWLIEDKEFIQQWYMDMKSLFSTGSTVKIIHNVGRNLDEMSYGLKLWLPFYKMGSVDSFYCPKIRDGIYHRSLFIAKGKCAIISTSIGGNTQNMLTQLIVSNDAVHALELEFQEYLSICKPLVKTTKDNDTVQFQIFDDRLKQIYETLDDGT